MDLDLDTFGSPIPAAQLDSLVLPMPLPDLPPLPVPATASPTEEVVVVKAEPLSPPPAYHLELGSEVDVLDVDNTASTLTASVTPTLTGSLPTTTLTGSLPTTTTTYPILVSLTPAYVVVLTAKAEPGLIPLPESPAVSHNSPVHESSPADETPTAYQASPVSSDCDSDSGIESASSTPPRTSPQSPCPSAGSSRTKPYSRPEPDSPSRAGRVKSAGGGGGPPRVVEKKLKKMEQNKTAATRYRQKKRVEQEVMSVECGELEAHNRELAEKVDALSREIKYLKDLMEEVRNAKNRRSKTAASA